MIRAVRQANLGFTLVELIAVIVILAITSVVGAGFVVNVIDQYCVVWCLGCVDMGHPNDMDPILGSRSYQRHWTLVGVSQWRN